MKKIDLVAAEAHIREIFVKHLKHMQLIPKKSVQAQVRKNERMLLIGGILQDLTALSQPDFEPRILKHLPMAMRLGYGECLVWWMQYTDLSQGRTIKYMMDTWFALESEDLSGNDNAIYWFTDALSLMLLDKPDWVMSFMRGMKFVEETMPEVRCISELMEPLPPPPVGVAVGH